MTPKQLAEPYATLAAIGTPNFNITTGDCRNYNCSTCSASSSCKHLIIGPSDDRKVNFLANYKDIVLPYLQTHHPELLI